MTPTAKAHFIARQHTALALGSPVPGCRLRVRGGATEGKGYPPPVDVDCGAAWRKPICTRVRG
jgi:hypothetical protein